MKILIATAVEPEAAAVRAGLADSNGLVVAAVGIGPAAAAARTGRLLALAQAQGEPFDAVVNAGIAGGFVGRAAVGCTVIGTRAIAADLGAESEDGLLALDELGFGSTTITADARLLAVLTAALPQAVRGDILTVSTITGTAATTARLERAYPAAVAEAMEGYGIACAATDVDLPYVELRTISNDVAPRDRSAWQIGPALAALTASAGALTHLLTATPE